MSQLHFSQLVTQACTLVALLAACGSLEKSGTRVAGAASVSEAEMILVPAGQFRMGSTPAAMRVLMSECDALGRSLTVCRTWAETEQPAHQVVLSAFYLDRYEVTNALFDRFVKATSYRTTAERVGYGWAWRADGAAWEWVKINGAHWRTPVGPGSADTNPDHPVVQVSWHDALAYCKWMNKRLPTEAEWERAARGSDSRRYPWGERWEASRANGGSTVGALVAVGSYPGGVGPLGHHDLAGNASEWVADIFEQGYYRISPEQDPKGPHPPFTRFQIVRVVRGGSWLQAPLYLRTTARFSLDPSVSLQVLGFRCAKDGPT